MSFIGRPFDNTFDVISRPFGLPIGLLFDHSFDVVEWWAVRSFVGRGWRAVRPFVRCR